MEAEEKVYRLAQLDSLVAPDCAFNTILPSGACHPLNFYLNASILLGQFLFGTRARFRVVPAHQWSFNSSSKDDGEDRSILGLVERGEADFTSPDMGLSPERISRLRYTRIVRHEPLCFVYKRLQREQHSLSMERLVWEPRGVWLLLVCCVALRKLIRMPKDDTRQPFARLADVFSRQWWLVRDLRLKWRERVGVLLHLIYGLALATMTKFLFQVFHDVRGFRISVVDTGDLVRVVTQGTFRLVADSPVIIQSLVQQKTSRRHIVPMTKVAGSSNSRLNKALELTPPEILVDGKDIREALNSDEKGTYPRHVFLGTQTGSLNMGLANCSYEIFCSLSSQQNFASVAYLGRGVPNRLSTTQVNVYNAILNRLKKLYFRPENEHCETVSADASLVLTVSQITGVLYIFAIALATAIFLVCVEWILSLLRDKRKPAGPLFSLPKRHPQHNPPPQVRAALSDNFQSFFSFANSSTQGAGDK